MKILVTGAAGFIGFHLVEALLKKGNTIVGIDNINDYYDVNLKLARLLESGINLKKETQNPINEESLLSYNESSKNENYQFLKLDITHLKPLEKLFKVENFDCVINLAAQAGVRYSIENPHAYIQSNVVGFLNVLECSRSCQIDHLIYASSSSVYGNRSKVPFSENEQVDKPISLYAATKKSNELMAHTYSHLYNFRTTGLRFFTVYGPWGRPDMAPILFADAIYNGKHINVFNNGDMERDFTYIDDIIDGIVALTIVYQSKREPTAEIFNIGNSKPVKLMRFIGGLEKEIGKEAIKRFLSMQDGDVRTTFADTKKLRKVTGYAPKTLLNEGLKKFIDWYRSYNNF